MHARYKKLMSLLVIMFPVYSQEVDEAVEQVTEEVTQDEQQPEQEVTQESAEPAASTEVVQSQTEKVTESPVAPTATTPVAESDIVGIDTVNIDDPAGNWLYKRIWWERAEVSYEKIKAKVNELFESRMHFFAARTDLDRSILDPFYMETGFGRGELQELVVDLLKFIEDQRAQQGGLDAQELELLQKLQEQQQALQKLKADIDGIVQLDRAVDDAITKLMEQVNLSRQYEQQAWNAFKDIAKALSDKRARDLYYSMETYKDNVSAILGYINGEFGNYFEKLIATTKESAEKIRGTLKTMTAQGVNFKEQAQALEEINTRIGQADEDDSSEVAWWQWPWVLLTKIWDGIVAIWHAIRGLFTGSTE
jgi:DNA repair exonuclease SbcCD ATPase subunit